MYAFVEKQENYQYFSVEKKNVASHVYDRGPDYVYLDSVFERQDDTSAFLAWYNSNRESVESSSLCRFFSRYDVKQQIVEDDSLFSSFFSDEKRISNSCE